jgi:aldehyde dehydrogenase (NAD+)
MSISVLDQRDALGVRGAQLFVDGQCRDSAQGASWTHHSPVSGEAVADLSTASATDVASAVAAARRAFDEGPWPAMKAKDRKVIVDRMADLVRRDADRLARLQALDNGIPLSFTTQYAVGADVVADVFDYHAGWIDKITGDTIPEYTGGDSLAFTLREPVGVVAAILPWNAPLFLFAQKVAPALAAGCTIVLKPSEYASFAVAHLTRLLEEAGLPPGVFNLVLGPADPAGEALITAAGIDKITFTGSRPTGSRILEASARDITRVSLELGGKSPNIVFADVDSLDLAAIAAFGMVALGLSGQGCVCQTRALVERSVYDEFVTKASGLAAMVHHGDPFDPATTSGPIINDRQLTRVLGYIGSAQEQGARLVVGGDQPDGDLSAGNWVNPTLFADVDNSSALAQEEVFGPVLAVVPFEDEADAIRLANDTSYGLGAGVQTGSVKRAMRVSRTLRAGTVGVNTYAVAPNTPFGGYRTSGLGREGGWPGIEAFTELKTVTVATDAGMTG